MRERRCKVPLGWDNIEYSLALGPNMIKEMEEVVKKVKQNLKIAQDHKKSYAESKIIHKDFNVGDRVYLKVNPKKSTLKLGGYAELSLRYWDILRC